MPEGASAAAQLRIAIANALYPISAYELADVCVTLGLDASDGDDPFNSKRKYVSRRVAAKNLAELTEIAKRVIEDYNDDEGLTQALASLGPHGVKGEMKNLIFASNGPKPRIVLRDAVNNVIEIVENAEFCLVYDRPLEQRGLTWKELTSWWAEQTNTDPDDPETRRALYRRLRESLSKESPPEQVLFEAYRNNYRRELGGAMPVLLPQVYLHYDPYTAKELLTGPGQTLIRQRMDFLMLLPNRARVVIEVDGKQHYSSGSQASPARYAEMVAEDRRLRLAGYEVYRFGAYELMQADGSAKAQEFFKALLARHSE